MHILIIEDDSIFAEILQTFLAEHECTSVVANSLAEAKNYLAASVFQFVLLDNHLPDGDGISFIATVKATSSIPLSIMMITADSNQSFMLNAFKNGADDFLVKPLLLDLLWQKMQVVHNACVKEATLKEQTKRLEVLLNKQDQEEKLARYVYEHISAKIETETECVDTYLQSSSVFNGDVFICDTAPNGNRFVILADATGHGLSAAISILPLVTTIKAMIRKGLSLPHIIHEANEKLCMELPDDKFVAMIGVEVNFHNQQMLVFNGGMPDIVSIQHDNTLKRIPSTSLALGIMESEDFEPGILTLESHLISNLFLFSDGLIEQQNILGEAFGMKRVMDILARCDSKQDLLKMMIGDFNIFNEMHELQDDLSMCDLQVGTLLEMHSHKDTLTMNDKTGRIIASVSIQGNLIADIDIVGLFDALLRCSDVVGDLRQRAFTVFAELISNALDHGVLHLDSALKNDFAGFAEYLALKEERLLNMKEEDCLQMSFTFIPKTQEMIFSIKDSGNGYEFERASSMEDSALSGRGLTLIKKLCKQVDISPPGNSTAVFLRA
jgi:response regulator of citrate/malate metabolism